jgi:predicted enzyme related to lactoylglutathione lyase
MVIKYVTLLTENIAEESTFFTSVLAFTPVGEMELWPGVNCRLFSSADQNTHFAIIPKPKNFDGKNVIILNTENCMQAFNDMQATGVEFVSDPYETAAGVIVEFKDKAGNHFVLLEERALEEL